MQVANRRESYFRVGEFAVEHPALAFFADERWRPLFTEVPVYGFVGSEPVESARVLARLDDDGRHPLLVERAYDRGRVFLWTSTLDPGWTRLPESPRTLVPLLHELLRYAARPPVGTRNAPLGTPLVAEVEGFPRSPVLVRPDGSRRPLEAELEPLGGETWRLPVAGAADRRGAWRVEMEGAPDVLFAVQADASEGNLERLSGQALTELHSVWLPWTPEGSRAEDDTDRPVQGELWRWFAAFCFAALVTESLFAAWLGRNRRSVP